MKKRLIYCDRCKHKVGHFTDDDWGDGMTHEFKVSRRPEPPVAGAVDSISLVVSAVRSEDWAAGDTVLGKRRPKVDLCRSCTILMMEEVLERTFNLVPDSEESFNEEDAASDS